MAQFIQTHLWPRRHPPLTWSCEPMHTKMVLPGVTMVSPDSAWYCKTPPTDRIVQSISWTFHTGDLYFPLSCSTHTVDSITMDLSSLCLVKPIEVITTQGGSWLHCFERIETKSRYNDEHWAAHKWWFNKAVESTKWQVLDIREKYRTRSVLAGAGVPVIDWENWVTAPYWQQPPSKYLFWPPR